MTRCDVTSRPCGSSPQMRQWRSTTLNPTPNLSFLGVPVKFGVNRVTTREDGARISGCADPEATPQVRWCWPVVRCGTNWVIGWKARHQTTRTCCATPLVGTATVNSWEPADPASCSHARNAFPVPRPSLGMDLYFSALDELVQIVYQGSAKFVLMSRVDYTSWTVHLGLSGPEGRWWRGGWTDGDVKAITVSSCHFICA